MLCYQASSNLASPIFTVSFPAAPIAAPVGPFVIPGNDPMLAPQAQASDSTSFGLLLRLAPKSSDPFYEAYSQSEQSNSMTMSDYSSQPAAMNSTASATCRDLFGGGCARFAWHVRS